MFETQKKITNQNDNPADLTCWYERATKKTKACLSENMRYKQREPGDCNLRALDTSPLTACQGTTKEGLLNDP